MIKVKSPLFILAAGLVLVGASVIGGYTIAKETSSSTQGVQFETATFQVDLSEVQGEDYVTVAGSNTAPGTLKFSDPDLKAVMDGTQEIKTNHKYKEYIKVTNNSSGEFPEYVRVVVTKRWVKKHVVDGKEVWKTDTSADPNQIVLSLEPNTDWKVLELAPGETRDDEKTVYYSPKPLSQNESKKLIDGITIKDEAIVRNTEIETIDEDEYVTISSYDNRAFEIKVKVDAVQARHTEDAMLGAWGEVVKFNDDNVTIKSIDGKALVNP